jgi:hypothetical protein
MRKIQHILIATSLLLGFTAAAAPPPTVLWAWEIPEDFRFLHDPSIGVAFLATSILLRDDSVEIRRRMQPMRVGPGTSIMAVIRIESDPRHPPVLSQAQALRAVALIDDVIKTTGVSAVQIDFDARLSERMFYTSLLRSLRSKIGPQRFLSITALVSWCNANSWLRGLPTDEIVPMVFRMGPEGPPTLYRLSRGGDFPAPECRGAYGVSMDELRPPRIPGRRRYFFNPRPWIPADISSVTEAK